MLCEKCKIREANIQYTEVVNGVKKEHHFCAQCAKEMDFGVYAAIFDGEFPLGKLLSGLLGIEDTEKGPDKLQQIACPTCGTSYSEFVKDSRFGCADCYSVFGPLMEDSIKQLQGSLMHTGKTPAFQRMDHESQNEDSEEDGSDSSRNELNELDARLKEALRFEDYETAAVCRDRIKELRKGNEGNA
ncbi:protein arginine kinase activator [Lacrimispora xylanisolvens]|jgi:protein arginine kinase activator|uniref:Protein arginine kinase activator n=1 Tax=Lacrimispora xylanisolvens TaxID=384636 RepID=A0A2S6HT74_9FIRM|nr:UvrB/UvrC motif-containing protein [Hungatella xylanolytica]MBE5988492.1 excinuclease ABC subunit B [Paenibacillaceae bacterium]PPK80860.1 protein arginine kinase activator [Hungatella xylanolytica]